VVDRLIGSFNTDVVPVLADGMSSGVARKMESEFRPTMQQMSETLEGLKICHSESGIAEAGIGDREIHTLLTSLERTLVEALSKKWDPISTVP